MALLSLLRKNMFLLLLILHVSTDWNFVSNDWMFDFNSNCGGAKHTYTNIHICNDCGSLVEDCIWQIVKIITCTKTILPLPKVWACMDLNNTNLQQICLNFDKFYYGQSVCDAIASDLQVTSVLNNKKYLENTI